MSDEAAVMIEPTACAVHGALAAGDVTGATVAILGAGTLGLCTLAALRALAWPGTVVIGAKYPEQRTLAPQLGATVVAEPGEVRRAVRRVTRSLAIGDRLTGGADVVIDCVGSADSVAEALAVVRPRGRIVMVGMPGRISIDLTALWHREIALVGAYAYGTEQLGPASRPSNLGRPARPASPASPGTERLDPSGRPGHPEEAAAPGAATRTFSLAMDLVVEADLGRLVTARYPLDRFSDAISHAANAGRRGATKVVFDLRRPGRRVASS
jgi:threonine dehydrogenase-like Zn-dependent dehydrogenase